LEKFKAGELQLLVCSDVAARGLAIGGLSHVFNFDVPHHAEDYVHRIGRTGRAGLEGHAFTIAAPEDRFAVEAIEKLIGHPVPPVNVEGLDPVDWAEEDGRRRRGRGRAGATARPRAEPRARTPAKPPPEKPAAERPARAEKSQDAPRRNDRAPREHREERRARTESRREPEPRRDHAHAEEHGPTVTGFGEDMPAFMLLRARPPRVVRQEGESDV
jgi:superfamily II DNA/RNA helicase